MESRIRGGLGKKSRTAVVTILKADHQRGYSMESLFRFLGWSRQGYEQMMRRQRYKQMAKKEVLQIAKKYREQYKRVGSRRLYYMIGITSVGINQFEQIMSGAGMTVHQLKRRIHTTDSRGHKHIYPNLLNGKFIVFDVNEVIALDLTYFICEQQTLYIFLITDVYSQRIVGAVASDSKKSDYALQALIQVIDLRGEDAMECTIHHSDYGSEYRSDMYIRELNRLKMQISMAENCIQNGYAERRNGTIKNDFLLVSEHTINNLCQLKKALRMAIHQYNHEVVQAKLGYLTPAMYEASIAALPPEQRPRMELYDFGHRKTTH